MKQLTHLLSLALLLSLCTITSCRDERLDPLSALEQHSAAAQSSSRHLRLSLDANTIPLSYESPSGTRAIGLAFDPKHPKYLPHITLEQSSFETMIYIRKKGSTDIKDFFAATLRSEDWKTQTQTERGIHLDTRAPGQVHSTLDIEIPEGKNIPKPGEQWEVAAILGTSDLPAKPVFGEDHRIKNIFYVDQMRFAIAQEDAETGEIEHVKMDLPYYADWTTLELDKTATTLGGHLNFRCVGALVHYRLQRIYTDDQRQMEKRRLESLRNNPRPTPPGFIPAPVPSPHPGAPGVPPAPKAPGKPSALRSTPVNIPFGATMEVFEFTTNLGYWLGACDFSKQGGLHWAGREYNPPLNQWGYPTGRRGVHSITVPMLAEQPVHLLFFVVPHDHAPAVGSTILQPTVGYGSAHKLIREKTRPRDAHGPDTYYNSKLGAVVAGKVHYGQLYLHTYEVYSSPQ